MAKTRKQRRLDIEVRADQGTTHSVALSVSNNGLAYLGVQGSDGEWIGTPLSREHAAKVRKWLDRFFAVGCEKHGAEGCVECEKRCTWCGDDGDMKRREGVRVCENCAWDYDIERTTE